MFIFAIVLVLYVLSKRFKLINYFLNLSWKILYFQYDYGLFHESVTHLARLWLNYVHKCICEVDFDQKSSYLWVLGLTTWTFAKYCFWSFRELYKLLLFDIVSFHFCIFVFVWSEKRPKNIVWSVLVTKKSTFAQVCT